MTNVRYATQSMNDLIDRFLKWLRHNEATLGFGLNPPAEASALAAVEAHYGKRIPLLLHKLYQQFDGQLWTKRNGLFYDLEFISLEQVLENSGLEVYPTQEELIEDGHWNEDYMAVKPYDLNPRWLPFASDRDQFFLSIDYDPGEQGTVGQVIAHGLDDQPNCVVADTFDEFITWYVGQLESGHYYIGEPVGYYDEPTLVFMIEKDTPLSVVVHDDLGRTP